MSPETRAALHALCFVTPRPWTASEFADLVGKTGIITNDTSDGFILGRIVAGEAEVLTLAVHPAHRRAGIGTRLVAAFEAQAAAHAASQIFLEVAEDNEPAVRLYRTAGYREAGRRAGYYRFPDGRMVDAIVMRRDLGSRCVRKAD